MQDGVKKPWFSKTIILNIVLAVAALFPAVADVIQANVAVFGIVWGTLNIVLRWVSKDKIVLSD